MPLARALPAAVLACFALAATASAQQPSPGCSKAPGAYRFNTRLTIDGVQRTALVFEPSYWMVVLFGMMRR